MPSQKPMIATRTDDTTFQKFKRICEDENRTAANLTETLIKNYIKQYESEYGEIEIKEK